MQYGLYPSKDKYAKPLATSDDKHVLELMQAYLKGFLGEVEIRECETKDGADPRIARNPYNTAPNDIQTNTNYGYKIVAVAFEAYNGWCAYRGLTTWTDQEVAEKGDEIDKQTAERLFPAFKALKRIYGNC